jgi:integrase
MNGSVYNHGAGQARLFIPERGFNEQTVSRGLPVPRTSQGRTRCVGLPMAGRNSQRKEKVGTVDEFKTKSAAMKACELLRVNVNREVRTPRTFGALAAHYTKHELPGKTAYTGEVYAGYLKTWILPKWAAFSLTDVKAVAVESWLLGLSLAPGTKAKIRGLMHATYNHAMRWEFAWANPITLVRQSAKRTRVPDVLTTEEIGVLLSELQDPWRTAVYLALTTGLRVSELLALKWLDFDFGAGEILLSRGIVRQHLGVMKTEASRKPIPLDDVVASVLIRWRGVCPFNQDADYIFGSPSKQGKQPYWPNAAMEDHIRPAVKRAGTKSKWVGTRCGIRLGPWSKAKARTLLPPKHCSVTPTSVSRWTAMSRP